MAKHNNFWLLFSAIAAVLVWTFWGGITELLNRWGTEEEYSHGYFIPLLSAYLIYQQREKLAATSWQPTYWGAAAVALAMAIFLVGEVSALYLLVHYALVAVIAGLALAVLGWQQFKSVLAPIALLLFCIPIPYFLEAELTSGLQLLSSEIGVSLIRLFGIPVFQDGNIIDLGVYKLQVVEACSGLNYLFPLLGLGFIAALMFKAPLWQRALLVLSTIPITIAMNSFRIATVGLLIPHFGTVIAEGFLHDFQGGVLFMVCTALLILEMWILAKLSGRKLRDVFDVPFFESRSSTSEESTRTSLPVGSVKPFVAGGALIVVGLIASQSLEIRDEYVPSRQPFALFPMQMDNWQGARAQIDSDTLDVLKLNDYLLARYDTEQSIPVELYMAYYDSQRKGASPHSPRVCLPGGGWEIASIERTQRPIADGESLPVNRALMRNGEQQMLVYYWFQQRGRTLNNEYLMKWFLFRDAMVMNRTDGALVRVTTPVLDSSEAGVQEAEERLIKLINSAYPHLADYIPEGSPEQSRGLTQS